MDVTIDWEVMHFLLLFLCLRQTYELSHFAQWQETSLLLHTDSQ
jgi:hypothetical protein